MLNILLGPLPGNIGSEVGTAIALFTFTSQNPDELAITENEELTILLGQCDEEGWLMAMNSKGEKGYIPENYLEIRSMPTQASIDNHATFQHQVPLYKKRSEI
jgi:hypothetical protein